MFKAAVEGRYNFVKELREYAIRAHKSRQLFEDNGFHLVYDKDIEQTISDGFFYTVEYKSLGNRELLEALLRCGIIAIPLNTTGSGQAGIRVCVSRLGNEEDFRRLPAWVTGERFANGVLFYTSDLGRMRDLVELAADFLGVEAPPKSDTP